MVGVLAAVLVATGAVSIASASSGSGGREDGRTLWFRTTLVSSAVNDAGHDGVADVSAVRFSMQRRDGSAAGQGWISCVTIVASHDLCHGAFVLANGQNRGAGGDPDGRHDLHRGDYRRGGGIRGGQRTDRQRSGRAGRDRPDVPPVATPPLSTHP
jgi:hypothetical protein